MVNSLQARTDDVTPRIAYDDLVADSSSLTASTTAPGLSVDLISDWRPDRRWEPTALPATITATWSTGQTITAWCCYGHTIGTEGASIKAEYSSDGGTTWTEFTSVFSPSGTEVLYKYGDAITANAFRWTLTGTTMPEIGVLGVFNELITNRGLQPGYAPPRLNRMVELRESRSRNGVWLGSSIENRHSMVRFQISEETDDWAHTYWRPFRNECIDGTPFFLHWNTSDDSNGAVFCSGAEFMETAYTRKGYISAGFNARADEE